MGMAHSNEREEKKGKRCISNRGNVHRHIAEMLLSVDDDDGNDEPCYNPLFRAYLFLFIYPHWIQNKIYLLS